MAWIRPGSHIHVGPGVFVTRGVHLKNNWWLQGSGKNNTSIKLGDNVLSVGGRGNLACVLRNFDFEGFYDYICVSDLTLDCNRANQPAFTKKRQGTLAAITTAARKARIARVRALGTWANPGEGFPFSVLSSGSSDGSNRVEIDSCENLSSLGRLTAISAFDQTGGRISGYIRNCLVTDNPDGAAYGAGGWKNFEVSDNRSFNMGAGLVIDTNNYENVVIERNCFRATKKYGLLLNGIGEYKNIIVRANVVEMDKNGEACFITNAANSTAHISDNTFIQNSSAYPAFLIGANTTGVLENNSVRERIPSDLRKATHLRVERNHDADGKNLIFGQQPLE